MAVLMIPLWLRREKTSAEEDSKENLLTIKRLNGELSKIKSLFGSREALEKTIEEKKEALDDMESAADNVEKRVQELRLSSPNKSQKADASIRLQEDLQEQLDLAKTELEQTRYTCTELQTERNELAAHLTSLRQLGSSKQAMTGSVLGSCTSPHLAQEMSPARTSPELPYPSSAPRRLGNNKLNRTASSPLTSRRPSLLDELESQLKIEQKCDQKEAEFRSKMEGVTRLQMQAEDQNAQAQRLVEVAEGILKHAHREAAASKLGPVARSCVARELHKQAGNLDIEVDQHVLQDPGVGGGEEGEEGVAGRMGRSGADEVEGEEDDDCDVLMSLVREQEEDGDAESDWYSNIFSSELEVVQLARKRHGSGRNSPGHNFSSALGSGEDLYRTALQRVLEHETEHAAKVGVRKILAVVNQKSTTLVAEAEKRAIEIEEEASAKVKGSMAEAEQVRAPGVARVESIVNIFTRAYESNEICKSMRYRQCLLGCACCCLVLNLIYCSYCPPKHPNTPSFAASHRDREGGECEGQVFDGEDSLSGNGAEGGAGERDRGERQTGAGERWFEFRK
jgi:hypothetical protein